MKQEYLENMSRRNNIKILGLPESKEEKTWNDTENLVKQTIKNTLEIEDEVQIERAHCVGKPAHCSGKEKMEQKLKVILSPLLLNLHHGSKKRQF